MDCPNCDATMTYMHSDRYTKGRQRRVVDHYSCNECGKSKNVDRPLTRAY